MRKGEGAAAGVAGGYFAAAANASTKAAGAGAPARGQFGAVWGGPRC